MIDRFYAGIGSRETPPEILELMTRIAKTLNAKGFVLRSGGADGADTAFENGASEKHKRIYLPWPRFNGRRRGIVCGTAPSLVGIAAKYHPAWRICSRGAKMLHTRNVAQVLGYHPEEQHSEFIVCWTPGAKGLGGTGQAIRIAKAHGIPVYDLADERQLTTFYSGLKL